MMELISDITTPTMCFYANGDPEHSPAVTMVHDERGCVPCCDHCTRWRAGKPRWLGHAVTCPEVGVLG